jgi:hypothetical protein
MTKYERRRFFERLVQLRALYRLRGSDDSEAAMGIDAVIEYGERRMADARAVAGVLRLDVIEQAASTTRRGRRV